MKVKSVNFDKHGAPTSLTVKMSVREAALMVRMIGPTNGTERSAIQSDGAAVGSDVYNCLTGALFNCFYEDGINEVSR